MQFSQQSALVLMWARVTHVKQHAKPMASAIANSIKLQQNESLGSCFFWMLANV